MVELSRSAPRAAVLALLAGTALVAAAPTAAQANDLAAMRAQLDSLSQQVAALEAAQAREAARVEAVEARVARTPQIQPSLRNRNAIGFKERDFVQADEFRPSDGTAFVLGNTEIEIGGFAKLDFIYDFDESTGDLFVPQSISPTDADDDEGFRAHANESRLFFKATTPTSIGDVLVHLEGDFFASTVSSNELVTNSFPFRLRHAYGSIDMGRSEILAGQFWSAFVPIETYPVTVDFGGPAGNSFLRQAQVRYTYDPTENLRFVLSAENSETDLRDGALDDPATTAGGASTEFGINAGLDTLPDIVATARYTGEDGLIKGSLLFRELNAPDSSDEELGYGIQISGRYKFTEKFEFLGSALYGEGIGRYLFAGFNQGAFLGNGTNGLEDGEIEAIETVSGFARLSYAVTDTVTLLGTYGYYDIRDEFTDADTDRLQSVHATMFWTPVEDFTVGAEVIYGRRDIVNGEDDEMTRLQASVKWSF